MRQPPYPIEQLAKAARDPKKLTEDEIRLIVTCFSEYRRASNDFESRLYSVTHERDRLRAENEFLIKLFNIKQGEFDVSGCSGIQTGALACTGERSSGAVQGQEVEGAGSPS